MLYSKGNISYFVEFKYWCFWGNFSAYSWYIYETRVSAYINNNLAESPSSVLVSTEPNKKVIEKDYCNAGNFVLVLFNRYIYHVKINLISKEVV